MQEFFDPFERVIECGLSVRPLVVFSEELLAGMVIR
jgi:hypothetical protein